MGRKDSIGQARFDRIDRIFFAFGEEPFRPKDRGKMEDRSAMTRDDRPNDPHSLKRHPFSLSPPENGGSSTLSFQLFDLYPPYPDDPACPVKSFFALITLGSNL
jgi:hypothetical protein